MNELWIVFQESTLKNKQEDLLFKESHKMFIDKKKQRKKCLSSKKNWGDKK